MNEEFKKALGSNRKNLLPGETSKEILFDPTGERFDLKTVAERRAEFGATITINEILKFPNCTPKGKEGIVRKNIKKKYQDKSNDGGDYHVRSLSGMKRAQVEGSFSPLFEKINELKGLIPSELRKQTRDCWTRNILTMERYQKMQWPLAYKNEKKEFISSGKGKVIFDELIISLRPELVYRFTINGKKAIGASKFVIKPQGIKQDECEFIALLSFLYADSLCKDGEVATHSFAIDVYGGKCISPSKDVRFTQSKLSKIVDEYFMIWEKLLLEQN